MSGQEARSATTTVVRELLEALENHLAREEALIVVHPKNNTPELRASVEATPKAELWVSKFVSEDVSLVISPALLGDMRPVVRRA